MPPKYQTVDLLHHCIIFNCETKKKVMSLLGYTPGRFDAVVMGLGILLFKV